MSGATAPLIFTPDLMARAAKAPRHSSPLLMRIAARDDDMGGPARRAQLERAAAIVPPEQRGRVLGPVLKGGTDDQVGAALHALLLAKALHDLGWQVEFEPEVDGLTPDLRISKDSNDFIVEIRRVEGFVDYNARALARLADSLESKSTRTPVSVRSITLPASASLKPFVRHLEKLWQEQAAPGEYSFHQDGVFVVFELVGPFDEPWPAYWGSTGGASFGGQHTDVQEHLDDKLRRYKFPHIVALDFVDPWNPERTVEDALFGQRIVYVPVSLNGGDPGEPYPGRAPDGIVFKGGDQGRRVRTRLQGVLAFWFEVSDSGDLVMRARVFENPGSTVPVGLGMFAPIPRIGLVERTEQGGVMRYVDSEGAVLDSDAIMSWGHVP